METLPVRKVCNWSNNRRTSSASALRLATGLGTLLLIFPGLTPQAATQEETSEQISPAPPPRFQTDLFPILQTHCLRCHNSEARPAGLDLSTEASLSGAAPRAASWFRAGPRRVRFTGSSTRGRCRPDKQTEPSPSGGGHPPRLDASLPAPGSPEHPHASQAQLPKVSQREVVPLMLLHCTACHGQRIQEAGLDLRSKASMLKGGKSGPASCPASRKRA